MQKTTTNKKRDKKIQELASCLCRLEMDQLRALLKIAKLLHRGGAR